LAGAKKNPSAVHGGAYAPYLIERWTRIRRSANGARELDLYYVLSTWNPYVVVLMSSHLQIAARADSTGPQQHGASH
jgi:hypothetical protein